MVQWLGLYNSLLRAPVQSLVGELRSHKVWVWPKRKKKNKLRCKKKSINKLECIHTMDYCSGVRRIELLIHAKTRMNLRNMILSERGLSQKLIQTKVVAFSCFLKKKGNYASHHGLFLMNSYWSPIFASFSSAYGASLVVQMVKNLSATWKTWLRYLG